LIDLESNLENTSVAKYVMLCYAMIAMPKMLQINT